MNWLLAAASGLLLALGFPRFSFGLVTLVALLPLLVAIHRPGAPRAARPGEAFRLGYVTGLVFFLALLHWIPFLPKDNVTVPFLMYPALGIMVVYLALYPAAASLVAAWLARRGIPVGLSFPLAWTLLEAARGTGMFGFPWGSLGYSLANYPHLVQFAAGTGIWGVTLWVAAVNGLVHAYLSLGWVRPKLTVLVVLVVLVALPYLHGRHVLRDRHPRAAVAVGIVQPNIGDDKWKMAVRDSVVNALLTHTEALARERAGDPVDLIIWPETAIPARLPHEPHYRARVERLVDSTAVPLLTGFPDGWRLPDGGLRFTNSAGLFLPGQGLVERYDKRHLVPFSEFFPLPFLNRFDFGQSNFSRGDRPGVFSSLSIPFGVLICFESIFPGPARELANEGVRYLVNTTNDQWFGDSAAPEQHFTMNVFRAIENRMGLVRIANTGISAVIDPYGIVVDRTPTFVQLNRAVMVELGQGRTLYARAGDWILALAGLILAVEVLLARRRKAA